MGSGSSKSRSRSPAPPPATKGRHQEPRQGGRSPAPPNRGAGSRRASFNPLRDPKPATPMPRPPPTDPNMAQCPICTRAFAKDRLEKHQTICEKTSKKKRKTFDPIKMRVKGTESEQYLKKIKSSVNKPEPSPKKGDWRKKHEEFVANIRAAKEAQAHMAAGGRVEDLPPPPPSDTSDYVECPHCGRRFNEAAADRHIPKCASISSNKSTGQPPPRQNGRGGGRKRR